MTPELRRLIVDQATAPYFDTGRFNYYWGRGKLGIDPIFPAIIKLGALPDDACVLDLGCGRGLLAAWMFAAEHIHQCLATQGRWPAHLPPPARALSFRGVELVGSEVDCGNHALQAFGSRARLECGDMRHVELGQADAITVLDVLHYIDYAEQETLLDRIRAALPAGGVFLTRFADADGGLRFRLSQIGDHCIAYAQGHRLPRLWCRPLKDWVEALQHRGFHVETRPMNGATPFANVMVLGRVIAKA